MRRLVRSSFAAPCVAGVAALILFLDSYVVRALLIEREGCAPLVHETEDARWIERREGPIAGRLAVGTIRLAPR